MRGGLGRDPMAVDEPRAGSARFPVRRGAAWLWPREQADAAGLAALIGAADRQVLLRMAEQARAAARPDATGAVADACEAAAGRRGAGA